MNGSVSNNFHQSLSSNNLNSVNKGGINFNNGNN
jgi:hypothetical protein